MLQILLIYTYTGSEIHAGIINISDIYSYIIVISQRKVGESAEVRRDYE